MSYSEVGGWKGAASGLSGLIGKFGRAGVRLPETKRSVHGDGRRHTDPWAILGNDPENGPIMMEVQKLMRKRIIGEVGGYLGIG